MKELPEPTSLQNAAWHAFNSALLEGKNSVVGQSLRQQGRALYHQAVKTRIEQISQKLDEQNRIIDMAMGVEVTFPAKTLT